MHSKDSPLVTPAQAQANEDLAELRDFYQQAPCGFCSLELDGRITRVNEMLLTWLGLQRDEVCGRRVLRDFFTPRSQADLDTALEWFHAKHKVEGLELELQAPGQPLRVVQVTATPLYADTGALAGARVMFYDVTEMRHLKEELAARNLEQAAMLHSDLVGIMRLRNRRIVWKNRTLEALLGYDNDELLGVSTETLYFDGESYAAIGLSAYPIVNQGRLWRTQVRMRHKAGYPIWVDMNGTLLSSARDESLWMLLDITPLKQYQEQVEHIAFHDALTGLPNRVLLADRLKQALLAAQRLQRSVAVCYIDIDGFKAVNDQHGHDVGDELLKQLAARVTQVLRSTDTAARIGGDEFVIVAPMDTPQSAAPVLARLIAALATPVELGPVKDVQVVAQVSGSIGVSFFPSDATSEADLLKLADRAMYSAKTAGKNQVRFASEAATGSSSPSALG